MAWSVRLQDENGKPVAPEDAGIDFDFLSVGLGKLLTYIDPYGDTVFNHLQMADFLAEWKRLQPRNEVERCQWDLVTSMAERCADEAHIYLKFVGD